MSCHRRPPPRSQKQLLPEQVATRLRILIRGGATRDEAAAAVGITRRFLDTRLRDQLADLRVGQGRQRRFRQLVDCVDPTAAEIAARAAEVRATWTEQELEDRWSPGFSGPVRDE